MEFAEEGGEAATPYEVPLHAAMVGQSARFTRQDSVQETWRILQPLLDAPPPVHPYAKDPGARTPPTAWWTSTAAGAVRGWCHEPRQGGQARDRRRRRHRGRRGVPEPGHAVAVPPGSTTTPSLQLPHRRACRPRRDHRLAVRAPVRLAEPVRRCSTGIGARLGPFSINVPSQRSYEPGTTLWSRPGRHRPAGSRSATRSPWARGRERTRSPCTPGPLADDDADHLLVRTVRCLDVGRSRSSWSASPSSTTAAPWPSGRWWTGAGRWPTRPVRPDRPAGDQHGVGDRGQLGQGPPRPGGGRAALRVCALSWAEGLAVPSDMDDVGRRLTATTRFGVPGADGPASPTNRWRPHIQRSALVIKGLTYMPTGRRRRFTTSLPETGGSATGTTATPGCATAPSPSSPAPARPGLGGRRVHAVRRRRRVQPGRRPAGYVRDIDGRRDLTESTRDDLSATLAPALSAGNGAFDQRQNDVFGAVLDSILLPTPAAASASRRLWPIVQAQAAPARPRYGASPTRASGRPAASRSTMCRPS